MHTTRFWNTLHQVRSEPDTEYTITISMRKTLIYIYKLNIVNDLNTQHNIIIEVVYKLENNEAL